MLSSHTRLTVGFGFVAVLFYLLAASPSAGSAADRSGCENFNFEGCTIVEEQCNLAGIVDKCKELVQPQDTLAWVLANCELEHEGSECAAEACEEHPQEWYDWLVCEWINKG